MKNNKRVLITGADGYIGSNLKDFFEKKGFDVYSVTIVESKKEKFYQVDVTDEEKILKIIKDVNPYYIIHTAGISSLGLCEKDKDLAWKTNVGGTRNIISAIKKVNPEIKLVFLSSDYVFSGDVGNYKEKDKVKAKTYYGKTKIESENDIKSSLKKYIICRTANVYGRGGNFFNFLYENITQNKSIDVFEDTFYTPTYINYLVASVYSLIESDFIGIIHIAGTEKVSRYEFAVLMTKILNKPKKLIIKSTQPKGGMIAKDSSLNTDLSRKVLNNYCPTIIKSLRDNFNNVVSPYFHFKDKRGEILGSFQNWKFEEMNYVESKKGVVRGNHYHKKTVEAFFIIKGKIKVELFDIKSKKTSSFIVGKKDFFTIKPNIVHTFYIKEDSSWINMLSKAMSSSKKDIYKLNE